MKRTEDDKVCQAPIKVVLGGQEYDVVPLVIRDSREWRAQVVELLNGLPAFANINTDDSESFGNAIQGFLVSMPDKVIDLFFGYAKELDRDEIEAVACEAEIVKAFEQVMGVAFPLASSAGRILEGLSK